MVIPKCSPSTCSSLHRWQFPPLPSLPQCTGHGIAANGNLQATGGIPPYAWSITSGAVALRAYSGIERNRLLGRPVLVTPPSEKVTTPRCKCRTPRPAPSLHLRRSTSRFWLAAGSTNGSITGSLFVPFQWIRFRDDRRHRRVGSQRTGNGNSFTVGHGRHQLHFARHGTGGAYRLRPPIAGS